MLIELPFRKERRFRDRGERREPLRSVRGAETSDGSAPDVKGARAVGLSQMVGGGERRNKRSRDSCAQPRPRQVRLPSAR